MNNLKVVIVFIIGIILACSISVYATATYLYNATDVGYNNTTVANALNDLYNKQKKYIYTETDYSNYGSTQYSLGQENSKGVMYNYGNGTSTSTGVYSFDTKISQPLKIALIIKDSTTYEGYKNIVNYFVRTSNGTYTRIHNNGSDNIYPNVMNGTVFTLNLESAFGNKNFEWIAIK